MKTLLSTVLVCLLCPGAVFADDKPAPILLESHVGKPVEDARYFFDYLVRTMGKEAPVNGAALRERIENEISRPSGSTERPKKIRLAVEDGRRLFIDGQFKGAVAALEKARKVLMGKVALVASDQTLRDALHKALLVLAHARLRLKQPDRATELVGQVIRSFPDRDLSMVQYGPELVSFYKKVRREMDRQPRGTLTVSTKPEKCLVFVNERFVGLSPAKVVDLYPGRYRVYVQRPREPGRIRLVHVHGGEHQIAVDFELDRVLRTEPFVGLQFKDRKAREAGEVRHAAAVALALDAPMTVVLGLRRYQGRRVIQGASISPDTGRVIRSAMVALEPAAPSPQTLKALGLFLVQGKPASGLIVGDGVVAPPSERDSGSTGFFSARVFKWITLGVAVAGLAAGITLIALDGKGTCDAPAGGLCPDTYSTMTPGVILTVGGGLAAIGSGVLFWVDSRKPERNASISPWFGRRAAGLSATLSF